MSLFDSLTTDALDTSIIGHFIPPYVSDGSWQPWDESSGEPCPVGFTCGALGNTSYGAFSCDELARIAVDEYGFGNVMAGTWCPEGEEAISNCPVGSYCPDTKTRIECPSGTFCPYKTLDPSFVGGGLPCDRCGAGAKMTKLSQRELATIEIVVFALLLALLIGVIIRRNATLNKERQMKRFRIKKKKNVYSINRDKRLHPKLEVIAQRLWKIQTNNSASQDVTPPRSLTERNPVLFIDSATGDIIFDAEKFFEILDQNNDGVLSFEELNKVLCLEQDQLYAFITSMRSKASDNIQSNEGDTVSRSMFKKYFLNALADASQLQPTKEEAEEIFDLLIEEAESISTDQIEYFQLYTSYLSSFLNDQQIYGIISRFKRLNMDIDHSRTHGLRASIAATSKGISRTDFINFYPQFLAEVTEPTFMSMKAIGPMIGSEPVKKDKSADGLDVAFENLSLTVKVGKDEKCVVNEVSGRLRSNTMTAVMGGSGSGKSSLLNALCGRAFYGKITGKVSINGNDSKIEYHKSSIGFVPQEDIVYADLTVRENLVYAGRLYLPKGTSDADIGELAEATMASLGLCRIANSLVGDATRRGVSGGEKKRVNIGVEIMKQPKILFLDEPTSGLDSRSAFVVMESLQRLCKQGMTIASVIHQPRTDIYAMFDSIFLLGVGGHTIFHGPATEARDYFLSLGFKLKPGDSQADWFLDISSGDIDAGDEKDMPNEGDNLHGHSFEVAATCTRKSGRGFELLPLRDEERGNFFVVKSVENSGFIFSGDQRINVNDQIVGINGKGVDKVSLEDIQDLLAKKEGIVYIQVFRQMQVGDVETGNPEHEQLIHDDRPNDAVNNSRKAEQNRETLYRQWSIHFENIPKFKKEQFYLAPRPVDLPLPVESVNIGDQFIVQARRFCLLSWRNRYSRLIDFSITIIAVFAITLLGGVDINSFYYEQTDFLWLKFIASPKDASEMLKPFVFTYAFQGLNATSNYALMVGLILAVLIGLNATKVITSNRLEFFRECQSGTSVTAFFIAASLISTIEQGVTAIAGATLAYTMLMPSTSFLVYLTYFFIISWLAVSWALLIATVVPIQSVSTVVGFFNAFFGMLFCGKITPAMFSDIYNNPALAIFSGFFSPLRFFVEGICVSEAKCFPVQSGYTVSPDAFNFPVFKESYSYWYESTYMAHTDIDEAIVQSCHGWYWWVPASVAVGVTIRLAGCIAINMSDRSKQGKKSLWTEICDGTITQLIFIIFQLISVLVIFVGLFLLSSWLILKESPTNF